MIGKTNWTQYLHEIQRREVDAVDFEDFDIIVDRNNKHKIFL